MKTSFKKLEYHFLVENTKIKNASFPYKTATSEANVKPMVNIKWTNHKPMVSTKWTNHKPMVSMKWTNHKGRNFASNHLIFLKTLFIIRTCFKELI